MDTNYQILFTIQLLHEYFLDEKNVGVEFIVAEDSKSLAPNAGMLWRTLENRFIALIRENDQHEPFINIPPLKTYRNTFGKDVFRIYLKIKNRDFNNYTNVLIGQKKIAYFSNLANNRVENAAPLSPDLYLSKKTAVHIIGKEYLPGDFVMEPASDNVFEVIKKHTSTSVSELADTSLWLPRQSNQFPSGDDMIDFAGDSFQFPLSSPVPQATVKIFGFNYDGASPDFSVLIKEETLSFDISNSMVKVDLHDIPAGRYKIDVDGASQIIYHDRVLVEENIYGVIEIFNHLPATNDYSFLDADEVIIKKDFTIRFPARSVIWKYIRKDNKAQTIIDTGTTNYVFNLSEDAFVSTVPIPLSETPVGTLKLTFSTTDHELFPLPNPTADRLGKQHQDNFDYLSADVFLNY